MVVPIILCGGSGTRLWPLSRELYSKQLLSLFGNQSFLQQTVGRLEGLPHIAEPILVCNEEHRFLVAEQLRELGKTSAHIILEPAGRNTAPALTLAALTVKRNEGDGILLVMPADHVIQDLAAFHAAIEQAIPLAETAKLVTFGIKPTSPETGYGYIRCGRGHAVAAFVEKPDATTAAEYIASGDYFWNSGMFLMRASVWLDELARFCPAILKACQAGMEQDKRDGDFQRVNKDAFLKCPSDSIDYSVMEKTDRAVVVPLGSGWSDIGAWSVVWAKSKQDSNGNVDQGDVYAYDTRNTLLIAEHRLLERSTGHGAHMRALMLASAFRSNG